MTGNLSLLRILGANQCALLIMINSDIGCYACRRQVELVQDLEFPAACHRMKATSDGQFLFATGIHAPRLRVYELGQLSMKFERHFDSEIIDFQV